MAAPKRSRTPQPRNLHPFLGELAGIFGLSEAGAVAEQHVKVRLDRDLDMLLLTLKTNPDWTPDQQEALAAPGGWRGLWRFAPQDARQLETGEQAMAIATIAALARIRAHETLKQFVDAEVARYGSTRAFATHLVDVLPGPQKLADAARDRTRQIKAQLRKVQEWTQTTKKSGAPADPRYPGEPKYVQPTAINAKRIAAARGDPERWARRVLEDLPVQLGVLGWWQVSESEFVYFSENLPLGAEVGVARHLLRDRGGIGFVDYCEAVANGPGNTRLRKPTEPLREDMVLLVVYQLKVTLRQVRAHTRPAGGAQEVVR